MTQPDPVHPSLQQPIAFLEQEATRLQTAIREHINPADKAEKKPRNRKPKAEPVELKQAA